jgi:hypothetical protein
LPNGKSCKGLKQADLEANGAANCIKATQHTPEGTCSTPDAWGGQAKRHKRGKTPKLSPLLPSRLVNPVKPVNKEDGPMARISSQIMGAGLL